MPGPVSTGIQAKNLPEYTVEGDQSKLKIEVEPIAHFYLIFSALKLTGAEGLTCKGSRMSKAERFARYSPCNIASPSLSRFITLSE